MMRLEGNNLHASLGSCSDVVHCHCVRDRVVEQLIVSTCTYCTRSCWGQAAGNHKRYTEIYHKRKTKGVAMSTTRAARSCLVLGSFSGGGGAAWINSLASWTVRALISAYNCAARLAADEHNIAHVLANFADG